jgi:hypothetical protein
MPIEECLKLILENGSQKASLNTAKAAPKTHTEGTNAFARVLLTDKPIENASTTQ